MERAIIPTGTQPDQRPDETPALNVNLLEQVLSSPNIRLAWKQVRQNKGSAGEDRITLEEFPDWVRPQWSALKASIRKGSYHV